jgi:hypothetical protein
MMEARIGGEAKPYSKEKTGRIDVIIRRPRVELRTRLSGADKMHVWGPANSAKARTHLDRNIDFLTTGV